ncbi:MAG: M48 family metalloprotease [Thermoanaerobaculia bacterium]|nr:M48 family metalloprotease [Thermoanaerobaculia bacterium]
MPTRSTRARSLAALALAAGVAALAACSVNPATGRNQLAFFSEAAEIELGAEVDRELLSNSGVYDDAELEAYVAQLGHRLAAVSERPDLPWSFRVADDEIVNAFALPGGRIYVTRGLLAHLDREAELAGVLGHEIGHVTARHSVNALSRELVISLGLVAGLTLLDAGETAEMVGSLGMGLLFLKFGRNQERQADQLGVRYAQRAGFDPHGVVDVLRVLQAVSHAEGDGWFPVWLSTHPDPDRRWQRLGQETGLGPGPTAAEREREARLFRPRLDGLVYGQDPRNGVLEGNTWVQLRDGYQLSFPPGWRVEREGQTVAAENPAEDALVLLLPQTGRTAGEAAAAFAEAEGVVVTESGEVGSRGLPAHLVRFETDLEDEPVTGVAVFLHTRSSRVVALVGLSSTESWPRRRAVIERAVWSLGPVVRPQHRAAEPDRLALVTLDRPMDAAEIARRYSPHLEPWELALLNRVAVDEPIPAGRSVKVVREGG